MDTSSVIMVKKSIEDYSDLKKTLLENNQLSYEYFTTEIFRKYLLISCASLFEEQIQKLILNLVVTKTNNEMVYNFLKNKAVNRQYHTYFDWKDKSANSFYRLFGSTFYDKIKRELDANPELKEQEKAFLEIGFERNSLVHQNFLSYQLNKTVDEISDLYYKALGYITFLESKFFE